MGKVSRRIADSSSTDGSKSGRKEALKARVKKKKLKKDLEHLHQQVIKAKRGLQKNRAPARRSEFVKLLNRFAEKREEYDRKAKGVDSKPGKTRAVQKICDRLLPKPHVGIYRNGAQGKDIRRSQTKLSFSKLRNARLEGNVFPLLDGYASNAERAGKDKCTLFDNANVGNPTSNNVEISPIFSQLNKNVKHDQKHVSNEKLSTNNGPSPMARYEQLCDVICSENFKEQDFAEYDLPDPLTVIQKKLRNVYSTAFRTKFLQNAEDNAGSENTEKQFHKDESFATNDSGLPEMKYRSFSAENVVDTTEKEDHRSLATNSGTNTKEENHPSTLHKSFIFGKADHLNISGVSTELRKDVSSKEGRQNNNGRLEVKITPEVNESGLETNVSNLVPGEDCFSGFLKKTETGSISLQDKNSTMLFGKELVDYIRQNHSGHKNAQTKVSIHINAPHKNLRKFNLKACQVTKKKVLRHVPAILKKQQYSRKGLGGQSVKGAQNVPCLFPSLRKNINITDNTKTMTYNHSRAKDANDLEMSDGTETCFEKNACTQSDVSNANLSENFFNRNVEINNTKNRFEKNQQCVLDKLVKPIEEVRDKERKCAHLKNYEQSKTGAKFLKSQKRVELHCRKGKQPSNCCIMHQNCKQIPVNCSQTMENLNCQVIHDECRKYRAQSKVFCYHATQNPETQVRDISHNIEEDFLLKPGNCDQRRECEMDKDQCRTKPYHLFENAEVKIREKPRIISDKILFMNKNNNVKQNQRPCVSFQNPEAEIQENHRCVPRLFKGGNVARNQKHEVQASQTCHFLPNQNITIQEGNVNRVFPNEILVKSKDMGKQRCRNSQSTVNSDDRVCFVIVDPNKNKNELQTYTSDHIHLRSSQESYDGAYFKKISQPPTQTMHILQQEAAPDMSLLHQVQNLRILPMEEEKSGLTGFPNEKSNNLDRSTFLLADAQPVKYLAFEGCLATQRIPIYTQDSAAHLEDFDGSKLKAGPCSNEPKIVLVPKCETDQVIYVKPQGPPRDCSHARQFVYRPENERSTENQNAAECGAHCGQKKLVRIENVGCEGHSCSLRNVKNINIANEGNGVGCSQVQYPVNAGYSQSIPNTAPMENSYVICYKK